MLELIVGNSDDGGRRRLGNPGDWVRIEITSALAAVAAQRLIRHLQSLHAP